MRLMTLILIVVLIIYKIFFPKMNIILVDYIYLFIYNLHEVIGVIFDFVVDWLYGNFY
jgi:hypothetical protein